jgi:hypothetical protein
MAEFGSGEVKWRYQVIDHGTPERPNFCVHEVYFEMETNRVVSYTANPIALEQFESEDELREAIEMMLADVRKLPILKASEIDKEIV